MTDHKPLPVQGYSAQPQENIDLVNEGKILEERVLRWLEKIHRHNATHPIDYHFLHAGQTDIQKGFMLAYRAVFQPGRIALPEDGQ